MPRGRLDGVSNAKRLHYSYEQYLALLEESPFKLEYADGVIYAMGGGTPLDARLSATMIRLLGDLTGDGCAVFTSDLKVRVDASDLSTFPDATVVCGPVVTSSRDAHAVTNPSLDRGDEPFDRGLRPR